MAFSCKSCGNTGFDAKTYKNPPGPLTPRRAVLDVIQWLGWHLLPLKVLPHRVGRRFAQGLFKFKAVNVCTKCGLGVTSPMPSGEELDRFYRNFYAITEAAALKPIGARGYGQADYLSEKVDMSSVNDCLELGAGSADLSRALMARNEHIKCTVVELSDSLLGALRASGIHRTVPAYEGPNEAFNLVMASHYLEHLVDVEAELRRCCDYLRPGGHLFIEVPNCGGNYWDLESEYIPHTWFFTRDSLVELGRKVGLGLVSVATGSLIHEHAVKGLAPAKTTDSGDSGGVLRALWQKQ